MDRASRPTVHDIAREAGVSLATVDRVLNTRPGVRERTVERVQDAIRRLGYVRDSYAAGLARRRNYRFIFVLPASESQFVASIVHELRAAADSQFVDRTAIEVVQVPAHDPHAAVHALETLGPEHLDGLAIMIPETPQIRDAVARLRAAGKPVVTLVSDLPSSTRDHFVGIDNFAAGRTAGVLLGRFLRPIVGSVMVVTNSILARDSIERRLGFDTVMAAEFPSLRVLPTLEWHEDPRRLETLAGRVIQSNADLVGVYSLGSGTKALLAALRRTGRLDDLVVIAHELTPAGREGLLSGAIDALIAQDVGHLVRSSLRLLRAKCDGAPIVAAQERIRIDILIRENLA